MLPKALATLAGQALACIEDPEVIETIVTHPDRTIIVQAAGLLPEGLAPPVSRFS